MRLDQLVAEVPGVDRVVGDGAVEITKLAYDSRKAGPGALFFCVVGEKRDGHDFALDVVEAGATALVVERELVVDAPQVVVSSARAAMAPLAARLEGDPTADLRVIGVTGTNGKTTTAFLIRDILEAARIQCGLLGTVKQVVGEVEEEVERTTPEAIDLQATFRRMLTGGDRACAMEVSSHALILSRVDAIHFELALFTNLTEDHLEFHKTMENYFRAKRGLFEREPALAVVNVDDEYGARLAGEIDCVTFSAKGAEADYSAGEVEVNATGARFSVDGRRLRTRLAGDFNVANALGAYAAGRTLGIEASTVAAGLERASPVPGRFEPIDEGQGFGVIVDYAHTADAIENVLGSARKLTDGRLISVFGAGGDRYQEKRPDMGRAGGVLSDLLIVTSDNPRSEQPEKIVAEVAAGAVGKSTTVETEVDRRTAIAMAFAAAEPGDMVVIAGKGHETGQEIGSEKRPFDDREVAREELRKLANST